MKLKESMQKLEFQRLRNTCLVVYNLLTTANKQKKILRSTENCVDHHTGNQPSILSRHPHHLCFICEIINAFIGVFLRNLESLPLSHELMVPLDKYMQSSTFTALYYPKKTMSFLSSS